MKITYVNQKTGKVCYGYVVKTVIRWSNEKLKTIDLCYIDQSTYFNMDTGVCNRSHFKLLEAKKLTPVSDVTADTATIAEIEIED